ADPAFVAMFIDEAKLMAQLTHPKVVQVLDFGDVGGQYFIALEYIDGADALALLRAAAQRRVRVPLPLVLFVVSEILDALDYAHTASDMEGRPMRLVHRDISPSNIFIARHGEVKLGDFGIAHADDRGGRTTTGTLKGKYGYMSPEQVVGAALDGRSDLFAVGIVLAEAFMGRRLFTAPNDLDVLLMVRDGRIDRLDKYGHDLPPELSGIVRKSLRRDPAQRYQTAAEFRDELSDYLFAQGIRVGPADLRAFMADLVDDSPEALERVKQRGRRLSQERPRTALPGAVTFALSSASGPIAVRPERSVRAKATAAVAATPTPSIVATGAPPAPVEAATPELSGRAGPVNSGNESARVGEGVPQPMSASESDQWSGFSAAVRRTGWTPVAPSPARVTAVPMPGFSDNRTDVGRFVSAAPARPPDSAGDLCTISPLRILADVTVAGETGLLRFERDGEIKEVFLAAGAPQSVNSSVPSDRFGAYLVTRGVLRPAELDMALGMLPHFSGKLGDTLVGLGLMRPLDVFRQLSQQVRDRVIEVFRWSRGSFAFYRGIRNEQENFPLGLNAYEILGAGVLTVPYEELEARFAEQLDSAPRRSERRRIDPDAFRLGPTPREVLALLDGDRTMRSWMAEFTAPDELVTFLRSLYLLVETDLAEMG
ncbi:MAG TPA: serine/threonine-protein kinase, partial [Polyangia bacterium]|nr:serine/threonine-protein kinase [Polyangia bacterium]